MNTSNSKRVAEQASVFLIAMGMTALFALILSSYLCMVEGHADAVARSQSFDTAVPVAESGVEEALALLNMNYPNIVSAGAWSNNLTANGWSSLSSSNTTTKSNLVFGGNYYQVTISNAPSGTPTIVSAGVIPYIEHAWGAQDTASTNYASTLVALVRTVQVQTTTLPLFGAALAATGDITFSAGAYADSFNSANTNLSLNGQYSHTMKDDKAIIGTAGSLNSSIIASGGVKIRGYINTGPAGTIISSGGVSIGDNNWVSNGTAGIEPSRSNDDFNVTFPDISAPSAPFVMTPSPGLLAGTNYTMVFEGNKFWGTSNVMYQTSLQLSGSQNAIVTNGSVVIYIAPGDLLQFSGSSYLYVSPGSSVSIYCAAAEAQFSGSNFTGATNAAEVSIYGLPACSSILYSGGSAFIGTIYAPEAALQASGISRFIGAIVANTADFTGPATFHYDENLGAVGPSTGFVANNWQEIVTPLAYQGLPP
jgi:hypothetical protein